MPSSMCTRRRFLSTLSLRRATCISRCTVAGSCHFYPRSPCGERLSVPVSKVACATISIHALLAESDSLGDLIQYPSTGFLSTLSLRRATARIIDPTYGKEVFLSTLSLRRATPQRAYTLYGRVYFYPRSPCGERPEVGIPNTNTSKISIHALLAESDARYPAIRVDFDDFYPRSPCGERQLRRSPWAGGKCISIHALLAESDNNLLAMVCQTGFISIHALLAESDVMDTLIFTNAMLFLSTLSLRRATVACIKVSIDNADFYPRSPCGERPSVSDSLPALKPFLSTLSLRRAT